MDKKEKITIKIHKDIMDFIRYKAFESKDSIQNIVNNLIISGWYNEGFDKILEIRKRSKIGKNSILIDENRRMMK